MLKLTEIMDSTCNFCEYQYDFAVIIKKALYEKYSSSQNYTYIRIINDLIFARRSRITNTFKDLLFWDYHDEYMENYFHSPNDLLFDTIKSNTSSPKNLCPAYFILPLPKLWIITTIPKFDNLENTPMLIPLAFQKYYRAVLSKNYNNTVHKDPSFISKTNLMILSQIVHYLFKPLTINKKLVSNQDQFTRNSVTEDKKQKNKRRRREVKLIPLTKKLKHKDFNSYLSFIIKTNNFYKRSSNNKRKKNLQKFSFKN